MRKTESLNTSGDQLENNNNSGSKKKKKTQEAEKKEEKTLDKHPSLQFAYPSCAGFILKRRMCHVYT
jgi:hypothetical protein